jgi:hypothetical protein
MIGGDAMLAGAGAAPGMEESASAMMEQPGTPGGWKLENISVRLAENGGVIMDVSRRRDAPPQTGGNGPQPSGPMNETYQSKTYSYSNPAEALKFIAQELGMGGNAMEPAAPAADDAYPV